jgi:hypothetical protein
LRSRYIAWRISVWVSMIRQAAPPAAQVEFDHLVDDRSAGEQPCRTATLDRPGQMGRPAGGARSAATAGRVWTTSPIAPSLTISIRISNLGRRWWTATQQFAHRRRRVGLAEDR